MTVTLPPEIESRVAQRAHAEGISIEAYVERVVREVTIETPQEAASLPEWPGHALNDLRRQDLYEDAR